MSKENGLFAKQSHFLRDVRGELKRVSWPSKQEVWDTTKVILVATFIFGLFLWAVDVISFKGVDTLLKSLSK